MNIYKKILLAICGLSICCFSITALAYSKAVCRSRVFGSWDHYNIQCCTKESKALWLADSGTCSTIIGAADSNTCSKSTHEWIKAKPESKGYYSHYTATTGCFLDMIGLYTIKYYNQ